MDLEHILTLFRAQTEAVASVKGKKDPGAQQFSRASITNFSYDNLYEVLPKNERKKQKPSLTFQELLQSHPLLMHVLVASMTKDKIESIQVQMSDFNFNWFLPGPS